MFHHKWRISYKPRCMVLIQPINFGFDIEEDKKKMMYYIALITKRIRSFSP